MQIQTQCHNVEKITARLTVFDCFNTLTLVITDKEGAEVELKLFADDLEKLTIHTLPVRIAYNK